MIAIVNINSDGTVDSYDRDSCKVSSASGDWSIIPHIVAWRNARYPSRLPNECQCLCAKFYFCVIDGTNCERLEIPFKHLTKISEQISNTRIEDQTLDENYYEREQD